MKTKKIIYVVVLLFFFLVSYSICFSDIKKDEIPPKGAKTIEEVAKYLQAQKIINVSKIEFEDSIWKVETYNDFHETKYYLNPKTLVINKKTTEYDIDSALPKDWKTVLEILKIAKKNGLKNIRKIEYEHSVWKVKAYKKGYTTKLIIDAMNGEVLHKKIKKEKLHH